MKKTLPDSRVGFHLGYSGSKSKTPTSSPHPSSHDRVATGRRAGDDTTQRRPKGKDISRRAHAQPGSLVLKGSRECEGKNQGRKEAERSEQIRTPDFQGGRSRRPVTAAPPPRAFPASGGAGGRQLPGACAAQPGWRAQGSGPSGRARAPPPERQAVAEKDRGLRLGRERAARGLRTGR